MIARLRVLIALLCVAVVAGGCSAGDSEERVVKAHFSRAVQVFPGNTVRVLGVDVGRIIEVENTEGAVEVTVRIDNPDVEIPADVNATIIPVSLLGERYVQLFPAYSGGPTLEDGATIPVDRTSVPVEQDELLRSLQDYFGALDPDKVARFVETTASVLRNNGENLNRLIASGSEVIGTLSEKRDTLANLIVQFNDITNTLLTRQEALATVINSYNDVARALNTNRDALEGTIIGLNEAAVQLASLLSEHRDPLDTDIDALARTARTLRTNVHRFVRTGKWAEKLFSAADRAMDSKREWLRLGNQGKPLADLLQYRLRDRLVGVCMRLGLEECSTQAFWAKEMPSMFCLKGSCPDGEAKTPGQVLEETIQRLPDDVREPLQDELTDREKKRCRDAKNPKKCRQRKQEADAGKLLDELIEEAQGTIEGASGMLDGGDV